MYYTNDFAINFINFHLNAFISLIVNFKSRVKVTVLCKDLLSYQLYFLFFFTNDKYLSKQDWCHSLQGIRFFPSVCMYFQLQNHKCLINCQSNCQFDHYKKFHCSLHVHEQQQVDPPTDKQYKKSFRYLLQTV